MKRFISLLISLIFLGLIFSGAWRLANSSLAESFRYKFINEWKKLIYFIKIHIQNIKTELNPPRRRPRNIFLLQDRLKMTLGEPFISYSYQDWQKFWDVIYGLKEVYGPNKERIKRQRTEGEIEDYLRYYYPQYFSQFRREHWKAFWQIIYSRR